MAVPQQRQQHQPGWVRLLHEPVEVPIDEKDGSILFTTVQSVIPGAHGLYYLSDGRRKALTFEENGRVRAPDFGWHQEQIYVYLAHGHKAHAAHFADYTKANDQFQRNITMVQKLIASAGLTAMVPQRERKRTSSRQKHIEQQPSAAKAENGVPSDEALQQLKKENEELLKRLRTAEVELDRLENEPKAADSTTEDGHELAILRERLTDATQKASDAEARECTNLERAEKAEKVAEEKSKELAETRDRADKAEWNLGEHRTWLQEAKQSAEGLENTVAEMNEKLQEAYKNIGDRDAEIQRLHSELDAANWSLGEHKHWLAETKDRLAAMEQCTPEPSTEKHIESELEHRQIIIDEFDHMRAELALAEERVRELEHQLAEGNEKLAEAQKKADEHSGQLGYLQGQTDAANGALDIHKQWLEEARNRIEELEAQGAQVPEGLSSVPVEPTQTASELNEATCSCLDYMKRIIVLQEELSAKQEEIIGMEQRIGDRDASLAELQKSFDDVKWSLGEHKHWLDESKNRTNDLEIQLANRQKELDGLSGLKEELKEKAEELERELENTQKLLGDEQFRVQELNGRLAVFSYEAELPREEEIMLKKSAGQLAAEKPSNYVEIPLNNGHADDDARERNAAKIAALESDLREAQERENATASKNDENQRKIDALEAHSANIQNELDGTRQGLTERDSEIARLQGELATLQSDFDSVKWSLGEHQHWLEESRARVAQLEEEAEAARKATDQTSGEPVKPQDVAEVNEADIEEIAELTREIDNLRGQLQLEKEKVQGIEENLRNEQEAAQKQNTERDTQLQQLQKQFDDVKWSLGEHKHWLDESRNRVAELEGQAAEKDKKISELQEASSTTQNLEQPSVKHEEEERPSEEYQEPIEVSTVEPSSECAEHHRRIDALEKEVGALREQLQAEKTWLERQEISLDKESELETVSELTQPVSAEPHIIEPVHNEDLCEHPHEHSEYHSEHGGEMERRLLKELEAQISQLNDQLRHAEQRLGESEIAHTQLRHELDDTKWSLGEHKQWLADAQNHIADLTSQGSAKDHRITELEEDSSKKSQQLQQYQQSGEDDPKTEVEKLRGELDRAQNGLREKDEHIQGVQKALDDANWSLGEHRHWLEEAKGRAADLERQLGQAHAQANQLQQNVDEQSKELEQLKNELQAARTPSHEEHHQEAQPDVAELIKSCDLESVVEPPPTPATEESERPPTEEEAKDDFSDLVQRVIRKIEADETRLLDEATQKLIQELKGMFDEQSQQPVATDEVQVAAAVPQPEEAPQETDDMKHKLTELQGQYDKLHAENTDLHGRLRQRSDEFDAMQREVDTAKFNLGQHKTISDLELEVGKLRKNLRDAEQAIHEREVHLLELQKELDSARMDLGNLQRAIGASPEQNHVQKEIHDEAKVNGDIEEPLLLKDIVHPTQQSVPLEQQSEPIDEDQQDKKAQLDQQNQLDHQDDQVNLDRQDDQEKNVDTWKAEVQMLQDEINGICHTVQEKEEHIRGLQKALDDANWSLGEHRQWLTDAKNRIGELEKAQPKPEEKAQHREDDLKTIFDLRAENAQLRDNINHCEALISERNAAAGQLQNEFDGVKWSLGEHTHWLAEARNRIAELEGLAAQKDHRISELEEALAKRDQEQPTQTPDQLESSDQEDRLRAELAATHEAAIRVKDEQIQGFQAALDATKWSLGEHQHWLSEAKNHIAELEGQAAYKNQRIAELEEAARHGPPHDEMLEEANNRLQGKLEGAHTTIRERDEQIAGLQHAIDAAKWSLGEHEHWLAEARNRIAELEAHAAQRDQKVSELEQTIAQKDEQLQQAPEKLNEGLNVENEELRGELDGAQNALREKDEHIQGIQKALDDANWSLGEHRQWLTDAKNRIAELEGQATARDQRIVELEEVAVKKEEQQTQQAPPPEDGGNQEIDRLQKELDDARNCIRDRDVQLQALRDDFDSVNWNLGEHKNWLEDAQNRVAQLEGQVQVQPTASDDDKRVINEQKEAIDRLHGDLNDAQHYITERNNQLRELQAEYDTVKWSLGEHKFWLEESKQHADDLQDQLNRLSAQLEQIRGSSNDLDGLRARIAELENENGRLRERQQQAEQELRELQESAPAEEEIQKQEVQSTEAAPPPVNTDLATRIAFLEDQISQKETEADNVRKEMELIVEERICNVSDQLEKTKKELEDAKQRIRELTDKEEEINNLHAVIHELREKLSSAEQKISDTEWHLGEHRDWLKNEKDKSGFCSSEIINNTETEHSRSQSPQKLKFSGDSDDMAAELLALSKANHRMAQEIKELRARPDPRTIDTERQATADAIRIANETNDRLEKENKRFREVIGSCDTEGLAKKEAEIKHLEEEKRNLEWKLGETTQWWNDAKWRIGELEAEVGRGWHGGDHRTLDALRKEKEELEAQVTKLQKEWHDQRWRIGELEAQLTNKGHVFDQRVVDGLRREKEELEGRLARLQKDWHDQRWRIGELESGYAHHEWLLSQRVSIEELQRERAEKTKLQWKIGELNKAWDDAKWRVGELEAEIGRLRHLGEDVNRLREEKNKADINISIIDKMYHDQKWRVGELEAELKHHKWAAEEAQRALVVQQQSTGYPPEHEAAIGEYIIYKRASGYHLWARNVKEEPLNLRRVSLLIDVPHHIQNVSIIGTFVNWECSAKLERSPQQGVREAVLYLPAGTYEFRFLADGAWQTSTYYPAVPNPFGTTNNVVSV